jgi:hypothetical protein
LRFADQGPPAAGAVAAVIFVAAFGGRIVNPLHVEWLIYADWQVHFLGWHSYRFSPWSWPLGATSLMGWPLGTSVALTDSIPLVAIPLKVLSGWLPPTLQYFGLWLLASFVLQGVFGALLLRLFTARVWLQAAGAALLVLSPALIIRIVHPALTAHWLLLAALWWTLRAMSSASPPTQTVYGAGWLLLLAAATATHAYLAFMLLVLMSAAYAGQLLAGSMRVATALGHLAVFAIAVGVLLWQLGFFIVGNAAALQGPGLGYFSMNLLSPILPPPEATLLPSFLDYATPGQYDGCVYLGAGVLLLAAAVAPVLMRVLGRWRQSWRWSHVPAALAVLLLTLLASSPVITAGPATIVEYDASWWGPLTIFRSTGRLIWPVYYALLVLILYGVAQLRTVVAMPLVAAAIVLQAADVSGFFQLSHERTRGSIWANPLASRFWTDVPPHYRRLILYPTNMCAAQPIEFTAFVILAGHHRLAINAGGAARYDVQKLGVYCSQLNREMQSGQLADDALYILPPSLLPSLVTAAAAKVACTTVDGFAVCFARDTYVNWQDRFDIVDALAPPRAELVRFYEALDRVYRDLLRRPALPAPGTREQRVDAIARYLGYRSIGCGHDEARAVVLRRLRNEPGDPLCATFALDAPMPSPDETFALRQDLDSAFPRASGATAGPTHVDPEGEAVWLREFVRQRRAGADEAAATESVLTTIRSVAATQAAQVRVVK